MEEKLALDESYGEQRAEHFRFDEAGRLIAHDKGAAGEITYYSYDANDRLQTMRNALDEGFDYFYDNAGHLIGKLDTEGRAEQYAYNAFDELVSLRQILDVFGRKSYEEGRRLILSQPLALHEKNYRYDARGRLLESKAAFEHSLFSYNAFGELEARSVKQRAAKWLESCFDYDKRGLLQRATQHTDAKNKVLSYRYDAFARLKEEVDACNVVACRYSYDKRDKLTAFTDSLNHTKYYTYDAFSRELTETYLGSAMLAVNFVYEDKTGKLSLMHPGTGFVDIQFHNAFGDSIFVCDAKGRGTHFYYDEAGRLSRTVQADGSSLSFNYDNAGRLNWQLNESGMRINYHYDSAGRLLLETRDPDGLALTTTYRYDGAGSLLSIEDAAGLITTYSYDADGRLNTVIKDPDGLRLTTCYHYDDAGHLLLEERFNPQGENWLCAYTYDLEGRVLSKTLDPKGLALSETFTYDLNGNLFSRTDPLGHRRCYFYDSEKRLRYELGVLGEVVEHRYDALGHEIERIAYAKRVSIAEDWQEKSLAAAIQVDEEDSHHWFLFDIEGRVSASYDAEGFVLTYLYDTKGNLLKTERYALHVSVEALLQGARPLPVNNSQSRKTLYCYDALNRLRFCIEKGRLTERRYDAGGRLIQDYQYQLPPQIDLSALEGLTEQIEDYLVHNPLISRGHSYQYDSVGRLLLQSNALGAAESYRYDALGRVIEQIAYANFLTTGKIPEPSAEDRITRFVYDAAGRERFCIGSNQQCRERRYDACGSVLEEIAYSGTFDKLESPTDSLLARHQRYHYDALGRLIEQSNAVNLSIHYQYDANGNLLCKSNEAGSLWRYVYDENNRLSADFSPEVSVSDKEGEYYVKHKRSIETRYLYDSFGNQRAVIRDVGFNEARVDYTYDRLGQQLRLEVREVMVDNSGPEPTAERCERKTSLSQERIYNAFGEVVALSDDAGHWRHFIYDNLGQKIYEINARGAVSAYLYDCFGNLIQKRAYKEPLSLDPNHHLLQANDLTLKAEANDRVVFYEFDAANRVKVKREGASRYFEEGRYGVSERESGYEYNAFGEVILEKTRLNDRWLKQFYYYDKGGLKRAAIDAQGYLTEYRYNSFGNLIAIDQFAELLQSYSSSQYQKGHSSAQDRLLRFEVDALGRIVEKRLLGVAHWRVTNQNLEHQTATLSTRYAYDALGNMVQCTDVLGQSAYCYYDALGRLIAKTGAESKTPKSLTEYNYDGLGHLSQEIRRVNGALIADSQSYLKNENSRDQEKTYFYNTSGQLSRQMADGTVYYYSYDEAGNLSRSWYLLSTASGHKALHDERYRYDALGCLLEKINLDCDGRAIHTLLRYNSFGELVEETLGNQKKSWEYNTSGQVWRSNQDGFYKLYLYDLKGRLSQVLQASNAFSAEHREQGVDLSDAYYDALIRFDSGRELNDLQRISYRYDNLDAVIDVQRISVDAGVLNQTQLEQRVDRWGNVIWQKDALNQVSEFSYNALDCLIEKRLPEVSVMDSQGKSLMQSSVYTYAYDALGRLISASDPSLHRSFKSYDEEGRVIEERDALGFSRYKTYDLLGHLKTSFAGNHQEEYRYDYDDNNHLSAITNAKGEKKLYHYDEAGQLLSRKNLVGNAGLIEESLYDYDNRGNLITKKEAGRGVSSYRYDEANRILSRQDANGNQESWHYDEAGRLLSHKDLAGIETRYQYNSNGLLLTEYSDRGKDRRFHYNANGTLRQLDDEGLKQVVDYRYDANGSVILKQSSQGRDTAIHWLLETDQYSYDAQGRLTDVLRKNPEDSAGEVLEPFSIHYDYDASGNIRHILTKLDNGRAGKASEDDYFTYDANARMLINKGVLQQGEIVLNQSRGSRLSYLQDGRLAEADAYNASGQLESFLYYYDALGRSEKVQKFLDGERSRAHTIKTQAYDEAGHSAIEFLYDSNEVQVQKNISIYEDGLLRQLLNYDLRFSSYAVVSSVEYKGYDAVGNLKAYQINAYARKKEEIGYTSFHNLSYHQAEGYRLYRDELKTVYSNGQVSEAAKEQRYDVNGNLAAVIDCGVDNPIYFLNDSETGIRSKKAGLELTGYLTVGEHHIADVHYDERTGIQTLNVYAGFTPTGAAQAAPVSHSPLAKKAERALNNHVDIAEALKDSNDADGRAINTPENSFAAYTVQAGDSLRSIALTVYGDASLWYLIADANGLSAGDALRAGLLLEIPAANTDARFNDGTHKIYCPEAFIGDVSAIAPTPKLQLVSPHHPWWKKALVALVSVVATVLAASVIAGIPAFGLAVGSSYLSAGLSLLTGANSLASMLAAFGAGFAGALASEAAALQLGMIDSFNIKSALATGAATAVGAGIAGFFKGSEVGVRLVNGIKNYDLNFFSLESASESMVADSATQLANLAMGEKKEFDWIETATATAMAGLINSDSFKTLDRQIAKVDATGFTANELKKYANASTEALAHGEPFNALELLGETLGTAIGDGLTTLAAMISAKDELIIEGNQAASNSKKELKIEEEELEKLVDLNDADRALIAADYAKIDSLTLMSSIDRSNPDNITTLIVFDGTWNDKDQMADKTNPALLYLAFDGEAKDSVFYTRGVGTDQGEETIGGATGYGASARVHKMYEDYVRFVNKSIKANNNAKFSLVVTGFSRGSAEAREFLNYLDEKGIPDQSSKIKGRYIHYFDPPKYTALVLFDTVASIGIPGAHFGFRLEIPKHVQAVLQITARDEERAFFPLTSILDKNNPYDQRLTEITLPGVHSDIGGGYHNEYSRIALDLAWRYLGKVGLPLNTKFNQPPSIYDKRLSLHDSRYTIDKFRQLVTGNHSRTIEYVHNPK